MSRTVDQTIRREYKEMELHVVGIILTMMIAVVLTLTTSTLFQLLVFGIIAIEVHILDYKYYTSTIWTILKNSAGELGLTCPKCGYDYYCGCDTCSERRDNESGIGWIRLECNEYDCGEECPKCGTRYSSCFLEDLDWEIYSRIKMKK